MSASELKPASPTKTGILQHVTQQHRKALSHCPSARDEWEPLPVHCRLSLSIIVLGASGDLARKKTFPALLALYSKGFLPARTQIVGYARTTLSTEQLRSKLRPHLQGAEPHVVDAFLRMIHYYSGEYNTDQGYETLAAVLRAFESDAASGIKPLVGRLCYLALPPSAYPEVCVHLRKHCSSVDTCVMSADSWVRVILEKPFGRDLDSSEELAGLIAQHWPEEQLYRIDHYLGKELVQNLLVLRFANSLFSSWWNRHYVANVQITFKEPFGTEGRGGYFDQYGIIRDVIQNHLIQVLALLAMEAPVSVHPDDIRDEKVKLLRCVQPARKEDCVLGQYTAANGQLGYRDDPTVPAGSRTPTYAAIKLHIRNERWAGVPFIIKAGKALNERMALVRMQLKAPAASLFGNMGHMCNELVIRFQPGEAIYAKVVVKKPGLDMDYEMSELDLTYPERYSDVVIPDAYERLILDCIRGDQQHFVRRDELRAAWAIFTPLLQDIDAGRVGVEPYAAGSRGPASADRLVADAGYVKTNYKWRERRSTDGSGSGSGAATPTVTSPTAAAASAAKSSGKL